MGHRSFWFLISNGRLPTRIAVLRSLYTASYLFKTGKIYCNVAKRQIDDDMAVKWLSKRLIGTSKGEDERRKLQKTCSSYAETTFQAVKGSIIDWQPVDDIINPYGDRYGNVVESVWTLDFDHDVLLFDQVDQHRRIPLELLRQRPITLDDFVPNEPTTVPELDVRAAVPPPYWSPTERIPERTKALVAKMLEDFAFQWRHILRHQYNESTFRKLSWAVIQITMLSFRVVEVPAPRRWRSGRGRLVNVSELPKWKPPDTPIIRMDPIRLVLTQDLQSSTSLIRQDYATRQDNMYDTCSSQEMHDQSVTHVVMSLRHVTLCRIDGKSLEYTEPEALFDGTNRPTEGAIRLLLIALRPAPVKTPIHSLPQELQDMIICSVSGGGIEGARIGCLLGLGMPFSWKSGDRPLELVECWRNSIAGPVEQQIWFGDCFSGLAYC